MDEYKSNSRLSRDKDKKEVKKEKVEKIVKGTVKTKKKNGFLGMFLSGDIIDIKDYIIQDVLIPATKNAIEDMVTNGISMLLNNGETRKSNNKRSTSSRISYRSYYEREENERDRDRSRRDRGYSYDDVILDSRTEAEEVIARLDELIDVYGEASVGDLYDLVGISSSNYTINNYGWTDVRSASHVRVRDGYLLKLPRARPL